MWFKRERVIPWQSRSAATPRRPVNFRLAWAGPLAAMALLGLTQAAYAATPLSDRMNRAFSVLVDLAQAVGYPVCLLMVCGGFLCCMCGRRDMGLKMIKDAAIGYIGLQFAPAVMGILAAVAQAMRDTTP